MESASSYARTRNRNRTPSELAVQLGVPSLREHQDQTIAAVADGRDVLLIAPTGGGKSIAFWGAGLELGGLTLIVSPLRSLIADQERRAKSLDLPVRGWTGDVSDADKSEILGELSRGWSGFFYTTPESLRGRALSLALTDRVRLAVVDEAHCCLRDRGFRNSYAWLGETLDRIRPKQRLACTATLPDGDTSDLIHVLSLDHPEIIRQPIARSNLTLRLAERSRDGLTRILRNHAGESGIVFCATVAAAAKLHATLHSQGWPVALYHGRLTLTRKREAQDAFMSGRLPVAIVTDAFLLGIDKADIRFTIHYDFPASIEAWVQGFGRAGRDGLGATCYGAFRGAAEGQNTRRFLIESSHPQVGDLRAVWNYLIAAPFRDETASDIGARVLGRKGKHAGPAVLSALVRSRLARADAHPTDGRHRLYVGIGDFDSVNWARYLNERSDAIDRFERMIALARLCEHELSPAIDDYFGDTTKQAVA